MPGAQAKIESPAVATPFPAREELREPCGAAAAKSRAAPAVASAPPPKSKKLKYALFAAFALIFCCGLALYAARFAILSRSNGKTFDSVNDIPPNKIGLVLGCSRFTRRGGVNLFFEYRMDAAAALLQAGKVEVLLVSGDNYSANYNEPAAMKRALLQRGVPEEKIFCDFAGFSTLDSIARAQQVFNAGAFTVVSQKFHNQRAIYIAENRGIRAIGFNARDVASASGNRTALREQFARVKTILDVKLFNKQPQFLGDSIQLGSNKPLASAPAGI